MYCSGCGTQIHAGLNYCSRCGWRISGETLDGGLSSSGIAATVGGVGFIASIFVILVLARSGVPPGTFVGISFCYFAALFGICFLLLRQPLRSNLELPRLEKARPEEEPSTLYSSPSATTPLRELSEPGIGSVIEHTTKTLDKIPVERR
jgi:hypothetical protein